MHYSYKDIKLKAPLSGWYYKNTLLAEVYIVSGLTGIVLGAGFVISILINY